MTLKNSPNANVSARSQGRRQHTRHPEAFEASDKEAERREREKKQLTADYRNVFDSDAGARVLRDLANICGFHKTSVCGSILDGTLDPLGTLHNEAMRKVYLHVRQYLQPSTLTRVENHAE